MDLMSQKVTEVRHSATFMHRGMKTMDFKIIKEIKKRRKHLGKNKYI